MQGREVVPEHHLAGLEHEVRTQLRPGGQLVHIGQRLGQGGRDLHAHHLGGVRDEQAVVVAAHLAVDLAEDRHLGGRDLARNPGRSVEEALVERRQQLGPGVVDGVVKGQGADQPALAALGGLAHRGQRQDLVEVGVRAQLDVHHVAPRLGVVLHLLDVADAVPARALHRPLAQVGP